MKPDTTAIDNARREAEEREREREMREREQRERERQRQREREERERKEKEEKLKREQQEREQRERERERERKERERREMERREMERERMLQQQRINESNKLSQAAAAAAAMNQARERSPHRSVTDMQGGPGGPVGGEMRIKEEMPRTKEEQDAMMMRASAAAAAADPRYHNSLAQAQANAAAAAHHASFMASRHGPHVGPPPPHLTRTMMGPTLGGPPMTHFGPAGPGWSMDPYRDPYGMSALRYNPLMEVALRHEEERHKAAMSMYAVQSAAHLRGKEPSPIPPPSGVGGPLGPPPPHHRLQPGPMGPGPMGPGGPPGPPQQTLSGKPPTLGGMPHPMVVDPLMQPKKEEPGAPPQSVMGMAPTAVNPANTAPGR